MTYYKMTKSLMHTQGSAVYGSAVVGQVICDI